jgi:NADPH2:quinone reductase
MGQPAPVLPFYPLMFRNVRLHMALCYLLRPADHARGSAQIGQWLAAGALSCPVAAEMPLSEVVAAHRLVESGAASGTVVVTP